ncbi:uncharacterized protein B4U80_00412 [Leptotrombidium deliense]|uniref:Uncharacterized protein n=1 Tax=Leptotrombidium deliense TaxID=299467 RepID=A0A443SPB0_9ACAR|nr:uncharacterized protein B4U80_00412 [Leptotrombidium deliense]
MPLLRTWVTEVFGYYPNFQYRNQGIASPCADLELNLLECMEASGTYRGYHMCYDFYEDFKECTAGHKQWRRGVIMRGEAAKQIIRGERKITELYGPPAARHSYYYYPMNP